MDLLEMLFGPTFRPLSPNEFRRRMGRLPLCSAVFCNEPATGVVIHRNVDGQNCPHDYCARHGRLISDEIATELERWFGND